MLRSELVTLKRNARLMGACSEYMRAWDAAVDERALMDIVLTSQGMDFLCGSCAGGWGLSVGYIKERFGAYINSGYLYDGAGYTSELLAGYEGEYVLRANITVVYGCHCKLTVPAGRFMCVMLCGGSKVEIESLGRLRVMEYGSDCDFYVEDKSGYGYEDCFVGTNTVWSRKD